jgi:hypothetical protein
VRSQVDPESYLGLEPSPGGRDTGGGVVLGAPPLLAGWPLHHLPHLPGKHVDSLLQRYQASKVSGFTLLAAQAARSGTNKSDVVLFYS